MDLEVEKMKLHTEEYLKELAPKRYKQLKAEGTLRETIGELNREMFDLFLGIKEKTFRARQDTPEWKAKNPRERETALDQIDLQIEEIVRDQLADKIRGMS